MPSTPMKPLLIFRFAYLDDSGVGMEAQVNSLIG